VTPMLFAKIVRFDRAFCLKLRYPKMHWNQIAYACDYSNYQHLVKDYREFTGLTPPAFDQLNDTIETLVYAIDEISACLTCNRYSLLGTLRNELKCH